MTRFLALAPAIALPAITLLAASPSFAQQACAPRSEIIAKLSQDFKENQQAVGVVNDKAVLEIFVSSKGSWTIVATSVDGTSCLLAAGKDWQGDGFVKGLDTAYRAPVVH